MSFTLIFVRILEKILHKLSRALTFKESNFLLAQSIIPSSYFKNHGWISLLQHGICSATVLVSRSLNIEGASNGIAEERAGSGRTAI